MSYDNERWEERPCVRCGHRRRVRVRDRREFVLDGTTRMVHGMPSPGGEFKVVGESFEERCRACKLQAQIRIYEHHIAKLTKQIREERARQDRANQKRRTLAKPPVKKLIP